MGATALAADDVSFSHYFTGTAHHNIFDAQVAKFEKAADFKIRNFPVGHERFMTGIFLRAASNSLPDVFTFFPGANTQFLVDSNSLHPIDEMWDANGLDSVIVKSVARSSTSYNGKRYMIPLGYDYVGMFYNKKVFAHAGVTSMPKTWDAFLDLCEKIKSTGVTPIALGSKNSVSAQFWFDYMLLRTAGPDYRAKLMAGDASYADSEVSDVMKMWKELIDKGYIVPNANATRWIDADQVARADAAMTLMITSITSYWDIGGFFMLGRDYDFFEFPAIKSGVPNVAVGLVDGLVISANAKNAKGAEEFLAFMASADAQESFTKGQGALPANVNVDPSNYNEIQQRADATVAAADMFALFYRIATPGPVSAVGESMFTRFLDDPGAVDTILKQTADQAAAAFKQSPAPAKQWPTLYKLNP